MEAIIREASEVLKAPQWFGFDQSGAESRHVYFEKALFGYLFLWRSADSTSWFSKLFSILFNCLMRLLPPCQVQGHFSYFLASQLTTHSWSDTPFFSCLQGHHTLLLFLWLQWLLLLSLLLHPLPHHHLNVEELWGSVPVYPLLGNSSSSMALNNSSMLWIPHFYLHLLHASWILDPYIQLPS